MWSCVVMVKYISLLFTNSKRFSLIALYIYRVKGSTVSNWWFCFLAVQQLKIQNTFQMPPNLHYSLLLMNIWYWCPLNRFTKADFTIFLVPCCCKQCISNSYETFQKWIAFFTFQKKIANLTELTLPKYWIY